MAGSQVARWLLAGGWLVAFMAEPVWSSRVEIGLFYLGEVGKKQEYTGRRMRQINEPSHSVGSTRKLCMEKW